MPLKWWIRSKGTGRYMRLSSDVGFAMITQKQHATVFEGTRDYIDGICYGATLLFPTSESFEPEQIIHVQKPINEKKMDDIPAGN